MCIVAHASDHPLPGRIAESFYTWISRSLYRLDVKLNRRPASSDLLVLQNLQVVAKKKSRSSSGRDIRPDSKNHFREGSVDLRCVQKTAKSHVHRGICAAVRWAFWQTRRAVWILDSLKMQLNYRTPKNLKILRDVRDALESVLQKPPTVE